MMMTFTIQHLNECIRGALVAHFLALPMKDRSMRFGSSLAPAVITRYVDGIDFRRDAVFGVHDAKLELIGVAHLAIEHGAGELALSVLPAHRRCGIGSSLIRRAVAHARKQGTSRLFMRCRSENASIMRMAQRFDMDIIASGGDAEAKLDLRSPQRTAPAFERTLSLVFRAAEPSRLLP